MENVGLHRGIAMLLAVGLCILVSATTTTNASPLREFDMKAKGLFSETRLSFKNNLLDKAVSSITEKFDSAHPKNELNQLAQTRRRRDTDIAQQSGALANAVPNNHTGNEQLFYHLNR